jgi:hypothetical protein
MTRTSLTDVMAESPATGKLRRMIAANRGPATPQPTACHPSPATTNATPPLTGTHLRTYERIFQHPVSHNLEWNDVHALFRQLGQVEAEPNGNLKVTRNGQTLVLPQPHTKDVSETDEVMSLRHFLERSETVPPETSDEGGHWLLVIDHHEARIFRSKMRDTIPEQLAPPPSEDYLPQAHHSLEVSRGQEKSDPNRFFEPIAKALAGAGPIVVFGTGTGMSSETEQFLAWSTTHHPDLARRIIGSLTVDEHHLTPDQLLAKARDFNATAGGQ